MALPSLVFDRASIQTVDREAVDAFGIPGIVLMENAARGLLEQVVDMSGGNGPVVICCGSGNNGGDGYALARHLPNRRIETVLVALGAPRPGTDASTNREICARMGLTAGERDAVAVRREALVVDALLGTGLDRPVRDEAAECIEWINGRDAPVLAVDVPSGLDCNTGAVLGAAVRADRTATMVGWKTGFLAPGAAEYLGDIRVIDIGAPRELAERLGAPLE